jgi:hypothetical protein
MPASTSKSAHLPILGIRLSCIFIAVQFSDKFWFRVIDSARRFSSVWILPDEVFVKIHAPFTQKIPLNPLFSKGDMKVQ